MAPRERQRIQITPTFMGSFNSWRLDVKGISRSWRPYQAKRYEFTTDDRMNKEPVSLFGWGKWLIKMNKHSRTTAFWKRTPRTEFVSMYQKRWYFKNFPTRSPCVWKNLLRKKCLVRIPEQFLEKAWPKIPYLLIWRQWDVPDPIVYFLSSITLVKS